MIGPADVVNEIVWHSRGRIKVNGKWRDLLRDDDPYYFGGTAIDVDTGEDLNGWLRRYCPETGETELLVKDEKGHCVFAEDGETVLTVTETYCLILTSNDALSVMRPCPGSEATDQGAIGMSEVHWRKVSLRRKPGWLLYRNLGRVFCGWVLVDVKGEYRDGRWELRLGWRRNQSVRQIIMQDVRDGTVSRLPIYARVTWCDWFRLAWLLLRSRRVKE